MKAARPSARARPRARAPSSSRWLARARRDPWSQARMREGVRSRAFFKLNQLLDAEPTLLPAGQGVVRVADLGAAPGGWCEAISRRLGARARIVALDARPMEPLPGVIVLRVDARDEEARALALEAAGGGFDLVLSDMAPDATGVKAVDRLRLAALGEAAFAFARATLAPGGGFVVKAREGASGELARAMGGFFAKTRMRKPPASRAASAERYLVGAGARARKEAKP